MDRPRHERLTQLFRRLQCLPMPLTAQEAKAQLDATLDAVEDAMTTIPYNPVMSQSDGRMYPAQEDNCFPVPGHPDVVRYRSGGHHIFIRANGALEIRRLTTAGGEPARPPQTGLLDFARPGADGRSVWDEGKESSP